jgi:inorganic phosphate transporter, PiT family
MVLSPLAGLLLAAILLWAIKLLFGRTEANRTERGFRRGQLASSAAVSLGHGTNDAQKTTFGVRRTLRAADLEPQRPSRPEGQPVAS